MMNMLFCVIHESQKTNRLVPIQIPLVIASKAKQSRHRINGKILQNRDFTD